MDIETELFLSILVLVLVFLFRRTEKQRWVKSENIPIELQEARLLQSEEPISTNSPRKMHGIPDQVYLSKINTQIIVDSKTRNKLVVYDSDIVQMSVYKLILESNGHHVSSYGYFRIVTPGETRYFKKSLLNSKQVIFKYDRTKAILSGNTIAEKADTGKCFNCTQKKNCL